MFESERTEEEVDHQRDLAIEAVASGGSRWPGMTYEQGVEATLSWLVGDRDETPMEED